MIRQEDPRTLGLDLRGWDLVRQVELEEEIRRDGETARPVPKNRSGHGFRQPRVHRHHKPKLGDHRHE